MGIFNKIRSLFKEGKTEDYQENQIHNDYTQSSQGHQEKILSEGATDSTNDSDPTKGNVGEDKEGLKTDKAGKPEEDSTLVDCIKWTFSEPFAMYYRESDSDQEILSFMHTKPLFLKSDTDLTVSRLQAKPTKPLRYIIFSGHVYADHNVDGQQDFEMVFNRQCTINRDSYYLVLDVRDWDKNGQNNNDPKEEGGKGDIEGKSEDDKVTLVILLHVPYQAVNYIQEKGIPEIMQNLISHNGLITLGQKNMDYCLKLDTPYDTTMLEKMKSPIGFDRFNEILPLDFTFNINVLESETDKKLMVPPSKHRTLVRLRDAYDLDPINYPKEDFEKIESLSKTYSEVSYGENRENNLRVDFANYFSIMFKKMPMNLSGAKWASLDKEFKEHFQELDPDCCDIFIHSGNMDLWNELLKWTSLHFGDKMDGSVTFINRKMKQLLKAE